MLGREKRELWFLRDWSLITGRGGYKTGPPTLSLPFLKKKSVLFTQYLWFHYLLSGAENTVEQHMSQIQIDCDDGFHWSTQKSAYYGKNFHNGYIYIKPGITSTRDMQKQTKAVHTGI